MTIKLNRENFLRTLESAQPGLSPQDIVEQSSCFVIQDGFIRTYNDEVACRIKSPLPKNYEGAVKATPLLSMLGKYKEELVSVKMTKNRFYLKGKGRETWVATEAQITMPLDNVDKPKNGDWQELSPDFISAVSLVQECAGKDEDTFALTCVHIHPQWVEASDNDQITRFRVKTGVEESVCVKRDAIRNIVPLGVTHMAVTETWVHFKNEQGLIVSCRRWMENYPNLSKYFKVKGTKTTLPKGLVEACDKASMFSQENENDWVKIDIRPGKLLLEAEGVMGGHREKKKIAYTGERLSFFIGPKLLTEIVKKQNDCILSDRALLIDGGKWQFVASLEIPNVKGPKDDDGGERAAEEDEGPD